MSRRQRLASMTARKLFDDLTQLRGDADRTVELERREAERVRLMRKRRA